MAEWAECLRPIEFDDALTAVRLFRDFGREDPPPVGVLLREANSCATRRRYREQHSRRAIEHHPSEEERERNKQMLRDIVDRIGK